MRLVSRVDVECSDLKPCCAVEDGSRCFVLFRMSFSNVFAIVDMSEIGLYEDGCVGGLFGLSIGMIVAFFQI